MPLWDDDRSITRLPNKMSEYLASGRPVVTSCVGDLTELLEDGASAYMAEPENERLFADKMIAVLEDPAKAEHIGAAGRKVCLARLDLRQHADALSVFFRACIEQYQKTHMAGRLLDNPSVMFVRNLFCRTVATGI